MNAANGGETQASSWRSQLFVPADNEKFIERAPNAGADGVVLDLEDGVVASKKEEARLNVRDAAARLVSQGQEVFVRVNRPAGLLIDDLLAVVGPNVSGVLLPKVDHPGIVLIADEVLTDRELDLGLAPRSTSIHVLIEDARGLRNVDAIAAADDRVVAMTPGLLDMEMSMGISSRGTASQTLFLKGATAALGAGCFPMGLAELGTDFSDLDGFRRLAETSRALGSVGSGCIHPKQVEILNDVFAVSEKEFEWASRIVAAYEEADATGAAGAFVLDGQVIDLAMLAKANQMVQTFNSQAKK
jgi:citrate lyase subunit beta/citryl-CoA lyase